MFGLGMPELLVVLVIGLLVFGASKLPEIGSSLGKAIRGFKGAMETKEELSRGETPRAGGPSCPGCGKPHPAEAVFCPHCGKGLRPPEKGGSA
ncbi:MAG: twin-arginine translocase TatA/TatE family subunit [Candidatus Methylomirabilales bacterium]